MNRHTYLLSTYRKKKDIERKEKALAYSRIEVDINGKGTSGYTINNGVNKGKVLGHITVKHPNKVFTKSTKDIEAYRNSFDERTWPPKTKF